MDNYTENLTADAADLYEYDAIVKLPEIIASFRGHGAALSDFLDTHGYSGENSPELKAAYLKEKFSSAGIDSTKARNASKWITEPNGFERETGFRIAFALHLTVEETDNFFRTVMLDRSFDCHTIREAVYYFCIFNGKDYPTAERLIDSTPNPPKGPVPRGETILYTKNIIAFLQNCPDENTLIAYFRENLTQFAYNQVKAKKYIRDIWTQISTPDGLAARERKYLLEDAGQIPAEDMDSTWNIYLQILGLDTKDTRYVEKDRTIKPLLDNPTFLHQFAAKNFPNRQSIEKIMRGVSTEHDLIRKTMILLVFYQFWINTALSHNRKTYMADMNDRERCLSEMDQYLLDAGFPEIYAGNPYDWIFLWAAGREAPLKAFRSYWQLLSTEYNELHSENRNSDPY